MRGVWWFRTVADARRAVLAAWLEDPPLYRAKRVAHQFNTYYRSPEFLHLIPPQRQYAPADSIVAGGLISLPDVASVQPKEVMDANAFQAGDSMEAKSCGDVISGGSTGLLYLLDSGYVRKTAYSD